MDKDTSWLTLPNGKRLEVPYHANSLPMLFEPLQSSDLNLLSFDDLDSANIHLNVADERNQNISAAQKEYILKHRMCSHANQQWCQELMRPRTFTASDGSKQTLPPVITTKHPGTKSAQKCICAGCMLGNLNRRSTKSSTTSNTSEMTLKQSHIYPGSLVFADQYESSVPGRRYETFGRENQLDKFKGGTLFYDAMSTLIYINHQSSSCTSDTLASKHKFEAFADLCAVDILGYRADNHIFNTDLFIKDCEDLRQSIDFCGVGAHHQNAAERAIQQVVSWARIMVIDAAIHWPDEIDLDLWPNQNKVLVCLQWNYLQV